VLVTGGHGEGDEVVNRWTGAGDGRAWRWPRLPGAFHGSGCTLASAIAARLALGEAMAAALEDAQRYCHQALATSYMIAPGQRIPRRIQA
jgi:hydroxymethylpyrimidine/phosphomethylpyrimidine kinase